MQTTVSTKGQVVLPGPVRRRMGIQPGDSLNVSVESGRIVLTPRCKRPTRVKIMRDAVTGLPVLSAGPDSPRLNSKDVAELLSNFP